MGAFRRLPNPLVEAVASSPTKKRQRPASMPSGMILAATRQCRRANAFPCSRGKTCRQILYRL
jgi:hypothetical protein